MKQQPLLQVKEEEEEDSLGAMSIFCIPVCYAHRNIFSLKLDLATLPKKYDPKRKLTRKF